MAVLTYKCPNCEGPLKWDGGKGKFICEYCSSAFTKEEIEKLNPDAQEARTVSKEEASYMGMASENAADGNAVNAEADDAGAGAAAEQAEKTADGIADSSQPSKMQPGTVKVYNCPSCGAQVVLDATTAATECFYCGNPVVISDKFEGDFDPDFVIPFEIDKKKAKEIFTSWLNQHKYVPDAFYKNRIDELKGVYFPYWVYSANVKSNVTAQGVITNSFQEAGMNVTEKNIYELKQDGTVNVNDISCIALNKASRELCENVAPFKFEDKKEFDASYLQGYMAEIRDIDKADVKEKIDNEVQEYARNQVIESISAGYGEITVQKLDLQRSNESYKYAMLPVWTLTYKGNDNKIYYFSINGQTGKTCGVLPVDQGKLNRLFIMICIPVFVILMALSYFLL